MSETDGNGFPKGFKDTLKVSWVRSSLILGFIAVAIGLMILLLLKFINVSSIQLFLDAQVFVTEYGLIGIFFATILAGTLVPLGSPALVATAAFFGVDPTPLILVATIGFTIGMMSNYVLAYYLGRPYVTRRVSTEKMSEVTSMWDKWGWILYVIFGLIPVLPIEFLAFICGLLKTRLSVFLVLSFVPRLIVFTILAYFGEQVGIWIGL